MRWAFPLAFLMAVQKAAVRVYPWAVAKVGEWAGPWDWWDLTWVVATVGCWAVL